MWKNCCVLQGTTYQQPLAEDDEEDAGGEDGEMRRQEARAHDQSRAGYEQAHEEALHLRRKLASWQGNAQRESQVRVWCGCSVGMCGTTFRACDTAKGQVCFVQRKQAAGECLCAAQHSNARWHWSCIVAQVIEHSCSTLGEDQRPDEPQTCSSWCNACSCWSVVLSMTPATKAPSSVDSPCVLETQLQKSQKMARFHALGSCKSRQGVERAVHLLFML